MPQLAVFPKAFMDELCVTGKMSLRDWVELASTLDVDGLEFYSGFIDLRTEGTWKEARKIVEDKEGQYAAEKHPPGKPGELRGDVGNVYTVMPSRGFREESHCGHKTRHDQRGEQRD